MVTIKTLDHRLLDQIPAGMWVAVSHDQERVVGKGLIAEEALAEARANGEPRPYVLRIPEGRSPLIL